MYKTESDLDRTIMCLNKCGFHNFRIDVHRVGKFARASNYDNLPPYMSLKNEVDPNYHDKGDLTVGTVIHGGNDFTLTII